MRSLALRFTLSTAVLAATLGTGSVAHAAPSESAPQVRAKALEVATQQIGDPYKRGAVGPNAFDCSGLTTFAFKAAGKTLPRTSKDQYRKTPTKVAFKDIQPGDLLFTSGNGKSADPNKITHVGIYAGDGHWIVARKAGSPVTKQRLWAKVHLAVRP